MAPRDFSDDGASGAYGGNGGTAPAPGGTPGSPTPPTMSDPGPSSSSGSNSSASVSPYAPTAAEGYRAGSPYSIYTPQGAYAPNAAEGYVPGTGYTTTTGGVSTNYPGDTGVVNYPGYAEGGLVTDNDGDSGGDSGDGNQWQSMVNDALSKVNNALSYGYQLHGLSGGAASALPAGQQDTQAGSAGAPSSKYQDFDRSPNVEDRRNNPPMSPVSQAVNNFEGKAYNLASRALPLDDQSQNPLSQQAGINDVDDNTKSAIPDEEQ
jgi:hypothetical protein